MSGPRGSVDGWRAFSFDGITRTPSTTNPGAPEKKLRHKP